MSLPVARITHELPGRLRVHIPERRRNEEFFQHVRESLAKGPGIEHVEANPLTGNILFLHQRDSAHIAELAHALDLFSIIAEEEDPEAEAAIDLLSGSFGGSGPLTHHDRLALVLVLLAIFETLRGNVAAPAVTLLWYALRLKQIQAQPAA
jgi:hypothetical protein